MCEFLTSNTTVLINCTVRYMSVLELVRNVDKNGIRMFGKLIMYIKNVHFTSMKQCFRFSRHQWFPNAIVLKFSLPLNEARRFPLHNGLDAFFSRLLNAFGMTPDSMIICKTSKAEFMSLVLLFTWQEKSQTWHQLYHIGWLGGTIECNVYDAQSGLEAGWICGHKGEAILSVRCG